MGVAVKTMQQLREEANSPEFMQLYNQAIAEGMNVPQMSKTEAELRNAYILYTVNGIGTWQPGFAQFGPTQEGTGNG